MEAGILKSTVDFSGVDLDIAKKNANQIYSLLGQYKTELKKSI